MVPTKQEYVVWLLELQGKEIGSDLWPIVAPIDVVTQEENFHIGVRRASLELAQHGDQVIELSVNVTHDHDFAINSQ